MRLWISPRISGWRVTDSIVFAASSVDSSAAWAMGRSTSIRVRTSLVAFGGRAADVDGGQNRKDERLQGGDQTDLEDVEGDRDRQRHDPDVSEAEQHGHTAPHDQDQQVAGEHV